MREPKVAGKPIRVVVVDPHEVSRLGYRLILGSQPWVERCLTARNSSDACELIRRYCPDVALVAQRTLATPAGSTCAELLCAAPAIRVLLIAPAGATSPRNARALGACGLIGIDSSASEIARAVFRASRERTVFPRCRVPATSVSFRELEVLGLIASGSTNREVAQTMCISPHTVKQIASSLYHKLGAKNRAHAVRLAEEQGLMA